MINPHFLDPVPLKTKNSNVRHQIYRGTYLELIPTTRDLFQPRLTSKSDGLDIICLPNSTKAHPRLSLCVLIWSISIRYRYDNDMVSIWYRYDSDMVSIWYRYDSDMVSIWYRYDIDIMAISYDTISIWYRYHIYRYRYGYRYKYNIDIERLLYRWRYIETII